jgi:hypothetical protein
MDGFQTRSGRLGEKNNLFPLPAMESRIVHPLGFLVDRLDYLGPALTKEFCWKRTTVMDIRPSETILF